ncbi:MAG: hypothetical protein EA379_00750 [Phycisphaerales bacterium]|nr:MAG: hypothetical protein EA379_00750 [Phycisphaerales bacterium]
MDRVVCNASLCVIALCLFTGGTVAASGALGARDINCGPDDPPWTQSLDGCGCSSPGATLDLCWGRRQCRGCCDGLFPGDIDNYLCCREVCGEAVPDRCQGLNWFMALRCWLGL